MNDLKTIILIAFILAIMFQLSLEISFFENYWAIVNPLIITFISCALITRIQIDEQNKFLKHLLKSIKINILAIITYIPICLILSARWDKSMENSIIILSGKFPIILSSAITTSITLLGTIIIFAFISFYVGKNLLNRT